MPPLASTDRQRAKPGEVIEPDELSPKRHEAMFEAGYLTEPEYIEGKAAQDHFDSIPASIRGPGRDDAH